MDKITIKSKSYDFPIFLPDATRGVIKGVDSEELKEAKVEGVVVNTYHLMHSPGIGVLKEFGGVKKFMNFKGLVVSDSGGWQVFSLIHRNKSGGKISDSGVFFLQKNKKKEIFAPEDSIKTQFDIGSDIIICLDDFTPPDVSKEQAALTVERTIKWAKKSKKEYKRIVTKLKLTNKTKPHIYAVVQGGYYKDLRKKCADELIQIGFDGYGYGGYAIDDEGNLDLDLSRFISELLPDDKPKFALGIGKPLDVVNLATMGWDVFDCTLPTRDARHRRLYVFNENPGSIEDLKNPKSFSYVHIGKEIFKNDTTPIDKNCDCHTCKYYSKAYIRHLFKIGDTLAYKLSTIHNLRVYTKTIEYIRKYK